MKKIIALILVSLFCTLLGAQVPNDDTLKFFRGVGSKFMGVDSNFVTMEDQLQHVDAKLSGGTKLNIVGHSQGGLRALAYASYQQQHGRLPDNIANVISIGGPTTGFSPLAQGVQVLQTKLDDASTTINGGMQAVMNLSLVPKGTFEILQNGGVSGLLQTLGLNNSSLPALLAAVDDVKQSYKDMKPDSDFLTKYIVKNTYEWLVFRTPLGRIISVKLFKIRSDWKLPKPVKYGFIVGTSSDILKTADDLNLKVPIAGMTVAPSKVASYYVKATGLASAAWDAIHTSYDIEASLLNPWMYPGHRRDARKLANNASAWRDKAKQGYDWVSNCESNFSSILGTAVNENDSFIPTRDQYIDVAEFGGSYIQNETKGRFAGAYNHLSETTHPDIWGAGGSLDINTIGADGKLVKWLYGNSFTSGTITGENID